MSQAPVGARAASAHVPDPTPHRDPGEPVERPPAPGDPVPPDADPVVPQHDPPSPDQPPAPIRALANRMPHRLHEIGAAIVALKKKLTGATEKLEGKA